MDGTTGQALPWEPNAADYVYTLAMNGSAVMAGGRFNSVSGKNQRFIVGLDLTTGQPTNFNPDINGSVTAMASDGTNIYLLGGFNRFAGVAREYGAAFNISTGQATNFNPPRANSGVASYKGIAVDTSRVYVGGDFTGFRVPKPGGITVGVTAFEPGCFRQGQRRIDELGSECYFQSCGAGNKRRNHLCRRRVQRCRWPNPQRGGSHCYRPTGSVTSWNPGGNRNNGNVEAKAFAFSEKTVYVAGSFERMDDQPRRGFAKINAETGRVTPWNANVLDPGHPEGHALFLLDNVLYVGGIFTNIGGQTRKNLAALDATTGQATNFQADIEFGTPIRWGVPWNQFAGSRQWPRFTVGGLYVGGKYQTILSVADIRTSLVWF